MNGSDFLGRPSDAELRKIAAKIRAIHHYGFPPDPRLQEDVDADVHDILGDVAELLRRAEGETPKDHSPTPVSRQEKETR